MDILTNRRIQLAEAAEQAVEQTQFKKRKQVFNRAIKRNYQRHDFYQKTR